MDRDDKKELYKEFLMKCTRNQNSANNYTDFKRINECLASIFPEREDISLLDFDDAIEFSSVVEKLNDLLLYKDYNNKCKNQYSNAVAFYQCYLNAKELFANMRRENKTHSLIVNQPLQQIIFGAPGTGKSHIIKEDIGNHKSFRVTFHPDTDYSSFVGAYKPTMKESKEQLYDKEELISILTELKNDKVAYSSHKFAVKYWYSLRQFTGQEKKDILSACDMSDSLIVELNKGIAIGEEFLKDSKESRIEYRFIPQTFLKAYIEAWKEQQTETPQPVYLVIEEINRGNCAQIFGDIFQLLDRNDGGFSDYAVVPDTDLSRHVRKELEGLDIANKKAINEIYEKSESDMVNKVLKGEVLLLPNNLYIWATMNTSDQSLFPIDSAFKRRWDWKYIKIADGHKDWQINVGTKNYDWWQFVQAINHFIFEATQSEDKSLGYYFAKAKKGVISADTFVSKVIFYLYTDVFKDYGFSGDIFKGADDEEMTFQSFYNADGSANESQIIRFIENVIYSESLPDMQIATPDAESSEAE